jgi:peptidyl-prolyl cis-trans isomerase B (cyclophilin B)|tara:strand:- start:1189 stop:2193 length:1005 start_codon:yes stop_codon:yes gene_type:complete
MTFRRERSTPLPRNIKNGCTVESILSRNEDDEETTTTAFNHPRRRRRDLMMITSSVFVFPTNAPFARAALDDDETNRQGVITNQVFFEFAIDGTKIGRVVVGVYGNESITARRFLALSKGIQGLSYRRKPIIGIEENEDETVETPLWITSAAIAKFEAPGTGEAINTVPGGLTNEELLIDLGRMKHDRANLVSIQVRDDPRMPKPEPKSKLVSNRGKFERVYEPLPPEPNGTSFSITYAPSEDLDVTNVVIGEVISGFDVLAQIGSLPTVPDNSDSPFFQVAKSIGDKRALVSEKSFGKPFAKVTLLNCGEVASTKPGEEVKSEDGAGEEQSSQ